MTKAKIQHIVTIAAFAAILLAWAPSAAYAGNSPAVIIKDFCFFPIVENGAFNPADSSTIMSNKNTANVSCHQFGVPNNTGAAYSFTFGAAEGCNANLAYGFVVGTCTVTVSYDADTSTGDAHMRANHMTYL